MAAVKVQERIGIRRTVDIARRLGVESPLRREPLASRSGTSDLTLLELTSAYGALANQGTWMQPTAIRYVLDAQRQAPRGERPAGRQVLSPELAYVITHMLRGTIERGTGAGGARRSGGPSRPRPAPPTTTPTRGSSASRRSSPPGVWVGYDRPRSLGQGRDGLARGGADLDRLHAGGAGGNARGGLPDSGAGGARAGRPGPPPGGCARPVTMAFVAGTEPKETCGPARYAPGVLPAARRPPRVEPPRVEPAPLASARGRAAGARPASRPSARSRRSPSRRATPAATSRPALARRAARRNTAVSSRCGDPDLLHRIAVADRHLAVGPLALVGVADRLHVHRDAVGRADLVLPAVEAPDGGGVVVDDASSAGATARRGSRAPCARCRRAS